MPAALQTLTEGWSSWVDALAGVIELRLGPIMLFRGLRPGRRRSLTKAWMQTQGLMPLPVL